MKSMPNFSVVFLTYNPGKSIIRSIKSVKNQTYSDFEIIVVDNASTDGTIARIQQKFKNLDSLRIVENEENLGFSEGIQVGIESARGNYICCFNHDTILPNTYLETVFNYISEDSVWTTARINYRVTKNHKCVRLFSRLRFTIPYAVDSIEGVANVNYVPGDGVIIPKKIIENELDGIVFNSELPTRGEDIDLSLRLRRQNIDMRAILDVASIHPDKGDLYSLKVNNLLELVQAVNARVTAHTNNNMWVCALIAAFSLITTPILYYTTTIPRPTRLFKQHTKMIEN